MCEERMQHLMPFDIGQKYLLNILMFSEEKS